MLVNDIAYAAGLFDGEGCVSVIHQEGPIRTQIQAVIGMTDRRPLDWLQSTFGGTIVVQPRKNVVGSKIHDMYIWKLLGRKPIPFFKSIRPYLKVKGEQVDLALELLEEGQWGKGLTITDEELNRRRSLKVRIQSLNQGSYL